MRLLIRIFILSTTLVVVFLSIWGGWALERIGTYILQTPVDINRVKFIPHRLVFRLYGIDLQEKYILIPSGTISIFPPGLQLSGLKVRDKILLGERGFSVDISRHRDWEIGVLFSGVDLGKLGLGFKKGELRGHVDGIYAEGNCELYGVLNLNNIIYSDTDSEILGISSSEFQKIIDTKGGNIELDFTYNGPVNEITELYRYRPGKKTLALIKKFLLGL